MHPAHLALVATAWLVAVAWLYKLIEAARGLPTIPNLLAPEFDRSNLATGLGLTLVTMLIAAVLLFRGARTAPKHGLEGATG